MAITYTSDADATPATGSTITFSGFAASGVNPVILVCVGMDCTVSGVATVTGVAVSAGLTAGTPVEIKNVATFDDPARGFISLWAIPAPSGTGTITVTLSASVPYQAHAILFAGADQTTPCPVGDAVTATGSTATLSATPTNLAATDAAVGFGGNFHQGDGPTFNQTQTFNDNTTNINAAGGYHLGTGAVSITWGIPGAADALVAVRVQASTGGSSPTTAQTIPALIQGIVSANYGMRYV